MVVVVVVVVVVVGVLSTFPDLGNYFGNCSVIVTGGLDGQN